MPADRDDRDDEARTLARDAATIPATLQPATDGGGERGSDTYLAPFGYELGDLLGRGGMGEVVAAMCQRIGREVAIKRIRGGSPTAAQVARFLREARVQARLDHPSIVPVYELGYDGAGAPYFTMKRLAGVAMTDLLAAPATTAQRLLRAFVDVCLAIELAHTRGVVHRDLKPSNIMLGDYGEVYVLDWGVARVIGDDERSVTREIQAAGIGTQTGDLLGTPGYMAPEQLRGELAGPAADVWALGAILFEILTREPVFAHAADAFANDAPIGGPQARTPDTIVPPELDALCDAAMSRTPAKRPTARELADRVQLYLDGDRDVARRKQLAAEQLTAAKAAYGSTSPEGRATAMRCAGRALALDPESTDAAALVSSLILQPPTVLPPALEAALAAEEQQFAAVRSRFGAYAFGSCMVLAAAWPFLDVRSWPILVGSWLGAGALGLISWLSSKRKRSAIVPVAIGMLALAIVYTRIAGPFLLLPVFTCGVVLALTANPRFARRAWLVALWTAATTLVPVALEAARILSPSWGIADDEIWVRPAAFHVHGASDAALLVLVNLFLTVALALFARAIHRSRHRAQRAIAIQAWHLQQLLPSDATAASTRRPGAA